MNCTSFGISTTTGPGRPVVAIWNASCMTRDRSFTSFTSQLCLVQGARDADRVAFLKRVGADEVRGDLPGQHDQRNGIHQRIGQAGHGVGGAGTAGHQHHAGLAGRARIAFGGVRRALLMAAQHMHDLFVRRTARRRSAAPRRPDSRKCA